MPGKPDGGRAAGGGVRLLDGQDRKSGVEHNCTRLQDWAGQSISTYKGARKQKSSAKIAVVTVEPQFVAMLCVKTQC